MTIENLALIVESVAGADPLAGNRSRPVVEARVLLVSALLAQGWTEEGAGAAIGYNHSTIHHYRQMLRDAEQIGNNNTLLARWRKLKKLLDL